MAASPQPGAHPSPGEARGGHGRIVSRWLAGALVACGSIWATSWPFLSSIPEFEQSEVVGLPVVRQGFDYRFRSEGWGETEYGRLGIPGLTSLETGTERRVLIWGDSMVEALQVPDDEKLTQVLTKEWAADGIDARALGVAYSGRQVGDHWALMPVYEAALSPIAHVVVITNVEDFTPDGRVFRATPELAFYEAVSTPPLATSPIRRVVNEGGLQFAWSTARTLLTVEGGSQLRTLRFRPGPVAVGSPAEEVDPAAAIEDHLDEWRFVVSALRQRTELPLFVAYDSRYPRLARGEVVFRGERETEAIRQLAGVCEESGIAFVDLTPALEGWYRSSGELPNGFANGVPGRGHWNAVGHRVIAATLHERLSEQLNALHPD